MPAPTSYPGVYIEELPGGVRTITGVATSITAFIGRALRGPADDPVRVRSYAEFERHFGGLWCESTLSYALQQFFWNGGTDALIVRVHNNGRAATCRLPMNFDLVASSPGKWGEKLRIRIEYPSHADDPTNCLFHLSVRDIAGRDTERFLNLSVDSGNNRYVTRVLEQESRFIRVATLPAARPAAHTIPPQGTDPLLANPFSSVFIGGDDGTAITDNQISQASLKADRQGLWALEKADLFNLLCIPPLTRDKGGDVGSITRISAVAYCQQRHAIYIVDPLMAWKKPADLITGTGSLESSSWGLARSENAALYFPYLRLPDPLQENRPADFAPCGAVAGVIARTDAGRGVWKAPAGNNAALDGAVEPAVKLTDAENGQLNPLAVNCLRSMPVTGCTIWGARTLCGADKLVSEWKYLPVRRTALFLEESLFRGTRWAVFEPNDESLWSQIRLNVGAFMQNLFRQGAFLGRSPREAYFVKCDRETTTRNDIDLGIIHIVIGFAPLKPAEFVVIGLKQTAGQIQAQS